MELKYVHITGYKNLVNTTLRFESNEIPISIIGNNGTGKSNLIEALLHIFIGIYYGRSPEFGFHIIFNAHNKLVEVQSDNGSDDYTIVLDGRSDDPLSKTRFKQWVRNSNQMPPFPSQIFAYYSGTCDRIENIVKKYNRSYLYKLKHQSEDLERQFVFSDMSQADWILLGLIAHGHHELLSEMGVDKLDNISLTFDPPESYMRDQDDPSFWGTEGGIREFLADIDNITEERYEPYANAQWMPNRERRVYKLRTEQLERLGPILERRGANLYSMLQALVAKKILVNHHFEIVHEETNSQYVTEELSEGEKQLLCVIGGLTLVQNTECLVLLDEPDTHLNPAWSWRYNNLLRKALSSSQRATSSTIIATHDPVLISGLLKEQVFIARNKNNELIYEQPYRDPRGQGVANILVSEYFGLPSSLDENTQKLLDERLELAYKPERLTEEESTKLEYINSQLEVLGLTISFRDPDYKVFEERKYELGEDV